MTGHLRETLRDRRVLEIACGTGHWTRLVATAAAHVTATDAGPAMRALAPAKLPALPQVTVRAGDAYRLGDIQGDFTGGLAMQWWSHVPVARRAEFLDGGHTRAGPGRARFPAHHPLTPP